MYPIDFEEGGKGLFGEVGFGHFKLGFFWDLGIQDSYLGSGKWDLAIFSGIWGFGIIKLGLGKWDFENRKLGLGDLNNWDRNIFQCH